MMKDENPFVRGAKEPWEWKGDDEKEKGGIGEGGFFIREYRKSRREDNLSCLFVRKKFQMVERPSKVKKSICVIKKRSEEHQKRGGTGMKKGKNRRV